MENIYSRGIFGFETQTYNAEIENFLKREVAGLIFFKRNYESLDQVRRLNEKILENSNENFILSIDQEGGRVRRLPEPFFRLPPMQEISRDFSDKSLLKEVFRRHGLQLRMLGFNLVFAPVADIIDHPDNEVIGDRSFGTTWEKVVEYSQILIDAYRDIGLLSCEKHFPGHGHTALDSHIDDVISEKSYEELKSSDLVPFEKLNADSVMTAHICFPNCTTNMPATFSTFWLKRVFRSVLEKKSSLISDDLLMEAAVRYVADPLKRVSMTLDSGADYYLWCKTSSEDIKQFDQAGPDFEKAQFPLKPQKPLDFSEKSWSENQSFLERVFSK